jgi:NAD(P)-dependent dehydrogenase (short-subunit alcohol dehydrogenase family)
MLLLRRCGFRQQVGASVMRLEQMKSIKPTVLVIGGAGGIGSAICRRFFEANYGVCIADVNREAGQALSTMLSESVFVQVDACRALKVAI